MSAISRVYRKRQLKKLLMRKHHKVPKRYSDIKKILFIFKLEAEASWATVNRCVQQLEQQGRQVWIIGYVPATYKLSYVVSRANTFVVHEKGSLNFLGIPKEEAVSAVLHNKYDMVIDATGEPNFFAQYITLRCDAGLRVAYVRKPMRQTDDVALDNTNVYDFTIQGDTTIDIQKFMADLARNLTMVFK